MTKVGGEGPGWEAVVGYEQIDDCIDVVLIQGLLILM